MANIFSWHVRPTDVHPGVQIDLLIDRADNVIDVCEMKYAPDGYIMTPAALENINTKLGVLRLYVPAKKFIEAVLVTSNGVKANKYSSAIPQQLIADQLFE